MRRNPFAPDPEMVAAGRQAYQLYRSSVDAGFTPVQALALVQSIMGELARVQAKANLMDAVTLQSWLAGDDK